MPLTLTTKTLQEQATEQIRTCKLTAKIHGDLDSGVIAAGYYAKKWNKSMFVYFGSCYYAAATYVALWRVTYKRSEYLCPIGNTGTFLFEVTPDLSVYRHEITR